MRRFSTFEAAALHVSWLRSEGYFAEAVHENAAHLYGPFPTMGIPVVCSEEALDFDNEQETVPVLTSDGLDGLKFVWRMVRSVAAVLLVGALILTLLVAATTILEILVTFCVFLAAIPNDPRLLALPLILTVICYLGYRTILAIKKPNSRTLKALCVLVALCWHPIGVVVCLLFEAFPPD